ncbi:BppU family phage baseplate upper protein [Bacillus altitudinis]|uniref:BppU family phage baseplate upper protein n=1 Tax=Bacillus altitudinis TaxID=293387 RepID=UPI00207A0A94|nr:BppU family phage baseplate upper protein [Bacillus altitudinis]USK23781.1 BppU family phage baseplate upper protein [Bacillus altitudinis]
MIRKNGPLDFNVDAYTSSSITTNINFWTQDRQTARLIFKLTKDGVPLPLAAVTGKLVLVMSDGSRFIRDVTIIDRVEGQAEYILSDNEVKHFGLVQAELNLYYTNDQSMSVHQFSFNISKSLIDQDIVPITEYYVDEFEALREKINELYEETIQTIDELRSKFEDLEKIETKEGAQSKADTALAAAKKYTNEYAETPDGAQAKADKALQKSKDFVSGFQQKKITADTGMPLISLKDTSMSILDAIINNGVGQGTFYAIAGSKDLPNQRSFRGFYHMTDSTNGKASFGWVYATDYANNIYTNYLNNTAWSGWSRISNHNMLSEDGKSQLLPNGTDILTLPSGYYYAVGTNVVNMPSKTDSSWFNIYVLDNGNNRKTFHVIRSADNLHWWGTIHTDGTFKGWDRMLTEKDLSSTWNQVTFVTGTTKHFAGNPLKFSIRLNALHLRGSFEGVPANDTIIARFAQKPSGETVFGGTTVGSYGSARLTLADDGSLKFNGLSANDNTKVTRIEINEEIPLW